MNRVCLVGRLTKDPELRYGQSGTAVTKFTIAVDDPFKSDGEADFIQIVTFKKLAEACANNLKKGRLVSAEGRWKTGRYQNNDGKTVYTNDCIADSVRFLDKGDNNQNKKADKDPFQEDGKPIDYSDADLPF